MNGTSTLRLLLLPIALSYSVGLGLVYVNFISPIFAYQGMVTQDLPAGIWIAQILLAVLPAVFLPVKITRPSEFQVVLLYTIDYVPTVMVGFHICNADKWQEYTLFCLLLASSLVALTQVGRLKRLSLPSWAGSKTALLGVLIAFSVVVYASIIVWFGVPDLGASIQEIYGARSDFKEKAATVPGIVNYLYWWQGIVVNPILLIMGIIRRNLLLIALGFGLEVVLFGLTTLRTMLLTVFFCMFFVFYFRTQIRYKGLLFLALLTVGMMFGALLMSGEGLVALSSRLFVQRWLAIQGQLTGAYFDFFTDHDYAMLGNSILRGVVSYPYGDLTPGEVIGDIYVSQGSFPISNATGNFWADAFGQFGYWGIVGATAAAFVILWLVDSAFRRYSPRLAIILFTPCAMSLTEQGVQMALLTGGILPLILFGLVGRRFFIHGTHDTQAHRSLDLRS